MLVGSLMASITRRYLETTRRHVAVCSTSEAEHSLRRHILITAELFTAARYQAGGRAVAVALLAQLWLQLFSQQVGTRVRQAP